MNDQCPECGSQNLLHDYDRAEVVCSECGLVVRETLLDLGPEWRAFDSEQRDKRERTGAPMTYMIHDKGLSTDIDWRNRDIHGRDLNPGKRAQIYRMRKWQRRIRVSDAMSRNLAFALTELNRLSSHMQLPKNIREAAAVLYRRAIEEGLVRGRSIEGVTAGCLYASCRKCKVPRTLDEIAEYARVEKKEIGRSYRYIMRELGIRLPPTNPLDYIPRFASELGVSPEVQRRAVEILKQAMEVGLTSGKGPMGAAAAALYISSIEHDQRKTQREVSEIAKVTEVTVRNRYKDFQEKLGLEVDV
ncbi:MAG: transcription initiation factor IIB [Theionarchaea archaeon]|nr:MAG: transcription initiation factor IIB [Theionarchaea archaeon DG-70-1]MBU7030438.1 transcription initiation factor IIB [Theionarchaea archaeon]